MRTFFPFLICCLIFYSCKTSSGVLAKKTAHEQYADKLDKIGLKQTALGKNWFAVAEKSITNSVSVKLPYKENGYFAADRPDATGLRFDAKRGEQLIIELSKIPAFNYLLFADLFSLVNGTTQFIQSIDTVTNTLRYLVKENTNFILRLQPELLQNMSYTITIKTGPSLAFPVSSPTSKNRVISVWGDGRDKGARKHEGVDIGGAFRTPLIAVGDGYVSRVNENNLGGKVVFISDANSGDSWYYAHLDSQTARQGQQVKTGDIIGLMGNTGNAKTTVPHLHFGIYTANGAVDPLPYINPVNNEPKPVTAAATIFGKRMRLAGKSLFIYSSPDLNGREKAIEGMPILITGATNNLYKAILPGGEVKFIPAANVISLEKRIKRLSLKEAVKLMDAPADDAPVIQTLYAGLGVDVLGIYGQYQYVVLGEKYGWIKAK
ncbi:MAG: M23 family metallopeptidase [Ferruginibacter sp.]